jgi:ubiquinone/menaquinone biosynthesis C-methylase UbiE
LAARQLDPRREAPHVVADLASLPIDSDSIDLLLIDRALERHPNPIRLLHEVHRVLRSGATCLLLARWRTPEGQLIAPQVSDRFTPTSLRNLISTCGLFAPIPIARRPMPNDEPKVLFLALRALPMQSEVPVPIGNPTHCAGPMQ